MNTIEGVEAYPLCWPANRKRQMKWRDRARFKTTLAKARDELFHEIYLLGGTHTTLSSNVPLRQDGLPYGNRRAPDDTGVAVYFMHKKKTMCFACDRWDRVQDNLQALMKTISAIRGIERWGSSEDMNTAFSGFEALPDKTSDKWWRILGVSQYAIPAVVQTTYKKLRISSHPDKGGSKEEFNRINNAFNEYLKYLEK